jgi:hypothetical protein
MIFFFFDQDLAQSGIDLLDDQSLPPMKLPAPAVAIKTLLFLKFFIEIECIC